ncbi:MAG: serine/threonine protein kinase [Deltaproteobacteria bacterium]|nr:serine/threonine protein kinase [Deltaproteobacteria bacterium]
MAHNGFEPQTFGKYLLTERIGAGGMAEIFRATAFGVEGFTKELCIKRILPTLTSDETFVRMFIDEAKIAVNLHHANIVQVFDLGRIGEHYFIAMELVRGRDLLQIINGCRARKERIPVHIALYLMSSVCQGLDHAHRVKLDGRPLGLIHRDVSPSNILISWEGAVKVADFGIAKAALKDEKTVTGTLKGKYGYLSPEQVRGDEVDLRSDIFAAGIVLYECLVGKRLFKGATDLETLEQVREARVAGPPSSINKSVPPEVDALVLRALSVRPEDRFQTAAEMHAALADQLFATSKRVDPTVLAAFVQALFPEEHLLEEERQKSKTPLPFPPQPEAEARMPSPATRPDIPTPHTPLPLPPGRLSPMALGVIGSIIIFILAAAAIGIAYVAYQPPAPTPSEPVEPPVEPARPVQTDDGTLEIGSRPGGARIRIDGADSDLVTPATVRGLDRKRAHRIELSLESYQTWSKQVEFGPVQMVAIDAQLQPEARKPVPPKKRRRRKKTTSEPAPARAATGTLNVNTVPVWAYVYVDGKKLARPTPVYKLELKTGSHTIRLVNPKLGLTSTRKVVIQKGKTVDLVVELK